MQIFMKAAVALFLLAGFSGESWADPVYSRSTINVRSGPGTDYNVISALQPNRAVNIKGCTPGWKWCKVESQGVHGWVYAGYLTTRYNNRRVSVMDHGPHLGLPILSVRQEGYWDRYYRNSYYDRSNWHHPSPRWGRENRWNRYSFDGYNK